MEMVRTITEVLVADHPEMKETFEANRDAYLDELEELHRYIEEETGALSQRAFIMYHPSYGYFADDYGFEMLAIEDDGKEETARGIEDIIAYARDKGIKVIFYQAEFDSEQAETIAGELGGITRMLTPLSPDYIESLKEVIDTFKEVL
jgi:zinc transport system substrate-binding protein